MGKSFTSKRPQTRDGRRLPYPLTNIQLLRRPFLIIRAHMMRKVRIRKVDGRDSAVLAKYVASLFGVAA